MTTPQDLLRETARGRVAEQGPCPPEQRVLAFYRGELSATDAETLREHLAVCPRCLEIARDARRFLAAMGESAAQVPDAPAVRRGSFWALAAALVLTVGAAGWGWWWSRTSPWREFAATKAAYPLDAAADDELRWRGESPAEALAPAMAPYRVGDYAEAERRLAAYLGEHPQDAPAALYRGVSLLLLHRPEQALTPLAAAAARGEQPVAREARWYLALARLELGERGSAIDELQDLSATAGRRQGDARELLRRLGARR